jgi:hypothetical protein
MPKIPLVSKNKTGFRLSQIDIIMLLAGAISTYFYPKNWLSPELIDNYMHGIILYIISNFFLFCNVFRIKTKYELLWLLTATINTLLYLLYYNNLIVFFITQTCFTTLAIIAEMKSATYHGIFMNKINSMFNTNNYNE